MLLIYGVSLVLCFLKYSVVLKIYHSYEALCDRPKNLKKSSVAMFKEQPRHELSLKSPNRFSEHLNPFFRYEIAAQ